MSLSKKSLGETYEIMFKGVFGNITKGKTVMLWKYLQEIAILLALALLMVVSVFASCGGTQTATTPNKQSTPQGSTPGNNGGGDVVDVPEEQKLNIDLDSIDYGGDTVRVFHWKPMDGCVEFGMDADDINNDAVNDAIFNRNTYTEEGLGITFEWVEQDSIY